MDESRKQFEEWFRKFGPEDECDIMLKLNSYGTNYLHPHADLAWIAWQASRESLNIELTPACWRTYYPDTDEHQYRAHSESGPESCARRIASEIGGYVVPVYHGKPQNFATGIKVKE